MKKLLISVISIFLFVFLAGFEEVKADTMTSNVSFTVTSGSLTLTSVPVLEFKTKEDTAKNRLSSLVNSSSEESYTSKSATSTNSLVVEDYRGAIHDNWTISAQLGNTNVPAFVNVKQQNGESSSMLSSTSTTVISKSSRSTKSQTRFAKSKLRINKNQTSSNQQFQGTVTWTLENTASNQN
ncbi:hypothetical protein [Liquorilactobacillus vini]|nr:hypothetical protein [Liquorilactobacillus vini]